MLPVVLGRLSASAQHQPAETMGQTSRLEKPMDYAARTRQRVRALFQPMAAVLYISAEALAGTGSRKAAASGSH
jgi:hypothetical protein